MSMCNWFTFLKPGTNHLLIYYAPIKVKKWKSTFIFMSSMYLRKTQTFICFYFHLLCTLTVYHFPEIQLQSIIKHTESQFNMSCFRGTAETSSADLYLTDFTNSLHFLCRMHTGPHCQPPKLLSWRPLLSEKGPLTFPLKADYTRYKLRGLIKYYTNHQNLSTKGKKVVTMKTTLSDLNDSRKMSNIKMLSNYM